MKKLIVVLMALGFVFVVSTASMAGHDCEGKKGKGHTSHGNGKGNGHSKSDPGEGAGSGPSDPGDRNYERIVNDVRTFSGPGDGGSFGNGFCDSLADKYTMPEYCAIVE